MVAYICNPAFGRLRWVDHFEFKASLSYIVIFSPPWAKTWDPVSKSPKSAVKMSYQVIDCGWIHKRLVTKDCYENTPATEMECFSHANLNISGLKSTENS